MPIRVLFVSPERFRDEDSPMIEYLQDSGGFVVCVCCSLKRAMLRLQNPLADKVDLVLINEYDHGWDGVELIIQIRADAMSTQMPIIALTTNCDPKIPNRMTRARAAGANKVFKIPCIPELLLGAIKRLASFAQ